MKKETLIWFTAADITLAMIAYEFNWKWLLWAALSAAVINAVRASLRWRARL